MQHQETRTDLQDVTVYRSSGLNKLGRALSHSYGEYTVSLDAGDTQSEKLHTLHGISLLERNPVIMLGTSIGVPYFNSRSRLRAIGLFLSNLTDETFWMIPDEPYRATCEARGLSKRESEEKINHYRSNLLSKIRTVSVSSEATVTALTWNNVVGTKEYEVALSDLQELYKSNTIFKSDIDALVIGVIGSVTMSMNTVQIAKDFPLQELACILSLQLSLSRPLIYVYQKPWNPPILQRLVDGLYDARPRNDVAHLTISIFKPEEWRVLPTSQVRESLD